MDLDEYRQRSLATWDRMSSGWDRERTFLWEATADLRNLLVERLDPQPGQTILEVAAGNGDLGLSLVEGLGDDGLLVSTDFAPGMVAAARAEAERMGISNAEFRQLDAERMDLADGSVDGVICRWGYMLMADPVKALSETRRVLSDGGRLAAAVWSTPERNMWAAIPGLTMIEVGHMPAPEPGAPGIFALGEPERLEEVVRAAGFSNVEIEEVTVDWGYEDPDVHWEKTIGLAGALTEVYDKLSASEQDEVRAKVRSRVEARIAEGPESLDGHCWVVTAS